MKNGLKFLNARAAKEAVHGHRKRISPYALQILDGRIGAMIDSACWLERGKTIGIEAAYRANSKLEETGK